MRPKASSPARPLAPALRLVGLGVCLGLVCGCAALVAQSDGPRPRVFRGEWFDHYYRALQYLDQGRYAEAEADLRVALAGYDRDSWEARTYGVHFIEYFPHRELGILLYLGNEHEGSAEHLERSLATAESSRAKFYLNRARKALMLAGDGDAAPPGVTFASPVVEGVTSARSVRVAGRATDDRYVSSVAIDGRPVFLELARPAIDFDEDVPLREGANEIEIVVEDLVGKRTRVALALTVDRQAPLLLVHDLVQRDGAVHYAIGLEDDGGLVAARIGEERYELTGRRSARLDYESAPDAARAPVPFEVTDVAGNRLAGELDPWDRFSRLEGPPAPTFGLLDSLAGVGLADADFRFERYLFAGADPGAGPAIVLREPGDAERRVMLERYYLEGKATSAGRLASLTIDDRQLLRAPAREVYFSHVVDLEPGPNRFRVAAEDTDGRRTEQEVAVERCVPEAFAVGSRLSLLIAPFDYEKAAERFEDRFSSELTQACLAADRFQLRARDDLEALLLERRIARTELADPLTAAAVGRQGEAEAILSGSLRLRPPNQGLEAVGMLVDTETGRALFLFDVYGEELDEAMVRRLATGLYLKFARQFPLLSGSVESVSRRSVNARLAAPVPVWNGMRFLLYREGDPLVRPGTGEVLERKTDVLAEGLVVGAAEDRVTIALDRGERRGRVAVGDRLIAK